MGGDFRGFGFDFGPLLFNKSNSQQSVIKQVDSCPSCANLLITSKRGSKKWHTLIKTTGEKVEAVKNDYGIVVVTRENGNTQIYDEMRFDAEFVTKED